VKYLAVAGLLLSVATLLLGCSDGGGGTVGPCVHIYEDGVLQVTKVRDARTHQILPAVILKDFTIDGAAAPPVILAAQHADNVELAGDSLRCTPPCGVGTQEGHYRFWAAAPGYAGEEWSLDVRYARSEGGCPSHSRGGQEIQIALEPR
jgi:hypothetical protein